MRTFFLPLALTLAVELPVAVLFSIKGKDLLLCLLVNVLTNPLVNLLHLFFPALFVTVLLELGAVAAEGVIYKTCGEKIKRPFLLSLTANTVSLCLGGLLLAIL